MSLFFRDRIAVSRLGIVPRHPIPIVLWWPYHRSLLKRVTYVNAGAIHCRPPQSLYSPHAIDGGGGDSPDAAGEGGGGVAYSSGSSCVKPQHQSQRATGAICDGQEGSASRIGNGSPRLEGSVIQEDRGVQDNMSGGSGSGSGGTSGGNGSGPFIGESVLSMMSSPEYSQQPEMQQQMRKRDQQHERQHHQGSIQQHMQQDQLLHQQQPQQSRTSVAGGHWPPSHGAFNEDWGLLLGGSAAQATNMPASQMTQGFRYG